MSILSGYKKFKKYIKTSSGFQLQSLWSNANTVEADDGKNMQTKVGAINGITSSTTANSTDIAASANLVNTRCNELSNNMGGKLPVLNYNITLSDDASVHAQKALRYLFTDAEAIKHTSFMFNILVNNADFYSGTCYTDGGNTAWGDINKRGSEADPGSVWKWVTYNFKTGGADPVLKKLGRSGTIAGVGGYWMDPPAGQNAEWTTGCVRWDGDNLLVTVEDDYAQGHLTVGVKVGSKSSPSQWGDKTGGLITLKY